jgi:hypothetical protein
MKYFLKILITIILNNLIEISNSNLIDPLFNSFSKLGQINVNKYENGTLNRFKRQQQTIQPQNTINDGQYDTR